MGLESPRSAKQKLVHLAKYTELNKSGQPPLLEDLTLLASGVAVYCEIEQNHIFNARFDAYV